MSGMYSMITVSMLLIVSFHEFKTRLIGTLQSDILEPPINSPPSHTIGVQYDLFKTL